MELFTQRTRDWFMQNVGAPTRAQELGWRAIASGEDALISAPTGSGKTLAAFLFFLDGFSRKLKKGELRDELQVIYISPLKALGNDIRENLKRPLSGLNLSPAVRTAVRTGDTEQKDRREMIKHPPHILITTPESLFLLLTSNSGRNMLKTAKAIVLDEFHQAISTKRGTHLMLSVARLDALCGRHLQRVALSATIKPLDEAARVLTGGGECAIIAPKSDKKVDLLVESCVPDMRLLPEHSVWPALADRVSDTLHTARTVLVFVNGRASCEKLAYHINQRSGEDIARTHHGCVSKEQRLSAEKQLKNGELKVMVATSSMELGIDVGEIDEVAQVGNPPSVSSLTQRLGRAGHSPGRTSRMRIYPRTASEGVACALTASAALDNKIEAIHEPEMCLDVLAQHLVSMAAADGYTVSEAAEMISKAYAYRDLTEETVRSVLRMLAGDYEHSDDKPVRPRVIYDRLSDRVSGDSYTRMLALSSGGTIPDRGWYAVTLPDGTRLGELDEEYVFEARLGDKFLLGAFPWKIIEITRDRVIVSQTTSSGATSPFWKGDSALREFGTGEYFGKKLREFDLSARLGDEELISTLMKSALSRDAAENAARVIKEQMRSTGCLPTDEVIIAEHFADDAGEHQLMIHSVFGGRVNRALSMLITREATLLTGTDARAYDDDDGALVYLLGGGEVPFGMIERLDPKTAADEVRRMLPASPMFSMLFRYNAARAMLMGAKSGKRQPLWVQRLRGAETLGGAVRHREHPMMIETLRECAEFYLDLDALTELLTRVRAGRVKILELKTDKPSPMSLNLRRQVEMELMYDTMIPSSAKQMAQEQDIELKPDKAAVDEAYKRRREPANAEELHTLLMTEGDIVADELSAPFAWLEELARGGRALYIEPGLWIARESEDVYMSALAGGDDMALARIVRRLARFSGAQNAETVRERYAVSEERAEKTLSELARSGALTEYEGAYLHAETYKTAQRRTVANRRASAKTVAGAAYSAALLTNLRNAGSGSEQLRLALKALSGEAQPPEAWEGWLLPARVAGYRPSKLDEALARGEAWYRVIPSERPKVAFHMPEDEDAGVGNMPDAPEGLTGSQKSVYDALKARGASFAHSLYAAAGDRGAGEALMSLAGLGLARADSFAPVREMIARDSGFAKSDVRRRVKAMDAGRWEICRPTVVYTAERRLEDIFDRYMIACRETAREGDWPTLLETLRRMEYAGQARRGYFVKGLSGAQFVRESDFGRVSAALNSPDAGFICVCAADPLQPWGAILKHEEGRQFMRLPSTAVVLKGGEVAAVFERQGEVLRVFDFDAVSGAVNAFAQAYVAGAVFSQSRRVTVKSYPKEAESALIGCGFTREMLDYTLMRRGL